MADVLRVSGTRIVTPKGTTTLSAKEVIVNATNTNVTGRISVAENADIYGSLTIVQEGSYFQSNGTANSGNPRNEVYDQADIYDTTEHRKQASAYFAGGVGIEKDLNVGGRIYGRITLADTSTQMVVTATNADSVFYPTFVDRVQSGTYLYGDNSGIGGGLTYNPAQGKLTTDRLYVSETDPSTSPTTGALRVAGGAGIEGDVNVAGDIKASDILPNLTDTYALGSTSSVWADAYLETVYTKLLTNDSGSIQIKPDAGLTEVFGDIRVRGKNPIGTAPVVTNTLYVTMDGNDTNDGRAMDPSRACRTIGGAMKSPYYQPGTQILVSAGRYLEDNPLVMKPYTSVRGSDIRTTFIEPINKTQDLFHVNSGCYLNYMNFLNGRSGRLEGAYAQNYNRGAYCAAFPPQTGDNRIDLFQSPYIQNCTNQSGPWLRDGTMFLPNQTIQVPQSVGVASWDANTTTLVVRSAGPIEIGQSIGAGQQNPGFFNARTLLLANKPFIQAQTIAWVDQTFNSGSFTYNKLKCSRDTGLIVSAIAQDMLYDSTSDSTFSGVQYWNQGTYTGNIPSEITATVAAITYVKGVSAAYANSAGGSIPAGIVNNNFDLILNILSTGTAGITDSVVVNGLPSTDSIIVDAYNALIDNITNIQNDTIAYIDNNQLVPLFSYDDVKFSRDTGLIVDSLAQDLLFVGRSQSTFAGNQYWNQDTYVGDVGSEITQITDAISYLKDLAKKIVVNDTSGPRFSSGVQAVDLSAPGSVSEANIVGTEFDLILNILSTGTNGAIDLIVPNGLTASTSTTVQNSYNLLQANKKYLQDEIIAYINSEYPGFEYNETKYSDDVAYMVDSVSFDLRYSGNKQAIQFGVYYWDYGNVTTIPNQIEQTTAAYNYIKELLYYVVQGIEVPNPQQGSQLQNLSLTPGTIQEVITMQKNIDYILDIINNGAAAVEQRVPIQLLAAASSDIQNAAKILNANRAFIQAEANAYIDSTFVYGYNKEKCRRDISYMVKSVAYDLLHGGNLQSIKSGVYYYSYTDTNTLTATNEVPATTAAYNFIKSIISDIVTGKTILNPYQLIVPQETIGYIPGSLYEAATLKNNVDIITGIVRNGPDGVVKEPINIVQNTATTVLNAYNLLIANKAFIQAEVIAFLDTTMNTFEYNRQLCYRDAGILVENMSYDMAFGGNQKSIESGKAYYRGVTSLIAGQEAQTIGAIDYIKELSQKIVQNQTCPVLPVPANIPLGTQVINTALVGGDIAVDSIEHLFNITTNIIANGPDAAPEMFDNSPGPDAAFVSAEVLMQANRTFIQENVLNYINYNLCDPPKALPYNQIKCKRDAGLIVDSVIADLAFPTENYSQATFAGLQYWNQDGYTGAIKEQLGPTIDAMTYLRDLSLKVVQNITTATDALLGVSRYTDGIQYTSTNYASASEITEIKNEFSNILTILKGNNIGWSDKIIANGRKPSEFLSVQNTIDLLLNNVGYMADEVVAYVSANYPGFTYSTSTCARDVGYIIESIAFDLNYGGNRQSIQSGLSYYTSFNNITVIPDEVTATNAAFVFIGNLASTLITGQGNTYAPRQSKVVPVLDLPAGSVQDANKFVEIVSTITSIIANGPSVANPLTPISLTITSSTSALAAYDIVLANRTFIQAETIAYLDQTYNPNSFNYDQELCYRDTGLIIDAVSQDVLLGGNQKSIESGLSYWTQGFNYVSGQVSTTTAAINYARDIALKIIANEVVEPMTGTVAKQVINLFYEYGGDYMPQEAVARNFHIITNIIENGPAVTPPAYTGGGLFTLTGPNGSSVNVAPKVTAVTEISPDVYLIGLERRTVGFGRNATLYFGDTYIYPLQDGQVEARSLEFTGSASTWNQRKVDPIGAMGGALIDGAVISDRSPIQSFVFDAFTQLNQGGIGVKVTNNGYSQLVSVFTIFCSIGVICDNGGIASITNSNCNFGDISLLAKGYGRRDFSGTVFNPSFRAYPFSPDVPGGAYLDQFYPNGYWPNNGGRIEVFVPDTENRPHIGQVMEIIPPDGHINEQGLPGFLNAQPSTSTLTTGTITLTGISTTDVSIGNDVFIRDQFGSEFDNIPYLHDPDGNPVDAQGNIVPVGQAPVNPMFGMRYAATDTVVTDVNYNSITLNKALTHGGGDPINPTYFTVYFCGNSYYTVQTSSVANQPYKPNTNILSANDDPFYEGPATSQIAAHVQTIQYLKTVVDKVIANIAVTTSTSNTGTYAQVINPTVVGGVNAQPFIDLRFDYMIDIIGASTITNALAVVPQSQITTSGTIPEGAGSAITLIQNNVNFIAEEIAAYIQDNLVLGNYNKTKCIRDIKLILQQIVYDLQSGGNYNSVNSGLSYWSRPGSYHIVELGEAVTRPDLFPDGSVVNFYQRSYISASGYLFEYVGAGTNYGALPQRGVADPVQSKETVQLDGGKVFFTSTDQNGDFRIGPGLVISQATGVLSGRTFVQSLYANMTPFILAIQ